MIKSSRFSITVIALWAVLGSVFIASPASAKLDSVEGSAMVRRVVQSAIDQSIARASEDFGKKMEAPMSLVASAYRSDCVTGGARNKPAAGGYEAAYLTYCYVIVDDEQYGYDEFDYAYFSHYAYDAWDNEIYIPWRNINVGDVDVRQNGISLTSEPPVSFVVLKKGLKRSVRDSYNERSNDDTYYRSRRRGDYQEAEVSGVDFIFGGEITSFVSADNYRRSSRRVLDDSPVGKGDDSETGTVIETKPGNGNGGGPKK